MTNRFRIFSATFCLSLLSAQLAAQEAPAAAQEYTPSVGQEGKDVIWVPTPEELVEKMLDMAKVTAADYVMDLGSGDGRLVIAAARRGAQAQGIEYNPKMVELSKRNAEQAGIGDKATFLCADLFETDFSRATVLTMYLLPSINMKLRPKILDLKPGTRVVSHAFSMEDWKPDQTEGVEDWDMEDERTAYLWIVPAKVAGTWTWQTAAGEAELTLTQDFQEIAGSLKVAGKDLPLQNAKLAGDRISFALAEGNPVMREYSGRVDGAAIEGVTGIPNGPMTKWVAIRHESSSTGSNPQ